MPASPSRLPASPTSSLSSFSIISRNSRLDTYGRAILLSDDDSDDEIVFSPRASLSSSDNGAHNVLSDDDFILLASPKSSLASSISALALDVGDADYHPPDLAAVVAPSNRAESDGQARASRSEARAPSGIRARAALVASTPEPLQPATPTAASWRASRPLIGEHSRAAYPSPSPSPPQVADTPRVSCSSLSSDSGPAMPGGRPALSKGARRRQRKRQQQQQQVATPGGFGKRGLVVESDDEEASAYQCAVNYISSFLSNAKDAVKQQPRLPLLQAMIIELGLCVPSSPTFPASIKTAKALLQAKAHINIRDYVAQREHGLAALKRVMFPSRSMLRKDLQKRRVPSQWVKDHGLNMFLINM